MESTIKGDYSGEGKSWMETKEKKTLAPSLLLLLLHVAKYLLPTAHIGGKEKHVCNQQHLYETRFATFFVSRHPSIVSRHPLENVSSLVFTYI